MIIAVDVDLVVAPIDVHWLLWLTTIYRGTADQADKLLHRLLSPSKDDPEISYNLNEHFKEWNGGKNAYEGFDPLNFFRSGYLYDNVQPIPHSTAVLNVLSEQHSIVFVTHIKGNHHKSKVAFLKRNYPFLSGILATKEKQFVGADILIDDRNNHLNDFMGGGLERKIIKYYTPYQQLESLNYPSTSCLNWQEVFNTIKKWEVNKV